MDKLCSLAIVNILLMLYFFGVNTLRENTWMNYILLWTSAGLEPFKDMKEGQEIFISNKCPFRNCFVTDNKGYFEKIEDFDIILFNALNLNTYDSLPSKRVSYQKYVFVSSKCAIDYPVPAGYEGIFNWTWTYRLDSDVTFLYVIVKNLKGDVIGPKREMHWLHPNVTKKLSKFVKKKLLKKRIAIAWIKSNCYTGYREDDFALQLKKELSLYNLSMDIYGQCGDTYPDCSIKVDSGVAGCAAKLQTDYYFYLVIEDAIDEDYVTDKILLALNNYAVPVVYGGANYSRFMPDGIYLNAYVLGVAEVVKQMKYIIEDTAKYYDYFKWRHYYSFHSPEVSEYTDNYCNFCTRVNNVILRAQKKTYNHMADWWYRSIREQNQKPIYVPVVKILKNKLNETIITTTTISYNNTKVNQNKNKTFSTC